jgi:UDP-N-acetylglucosamine transferase subunit ALG13
LFNLNDQANILTKQKRILVAPLDWGLGHACRCIPVIRTLVDSGFEVSLGGSGVSGELLQREFPNLPYDEIPGYEVTYSLKVPMSIAMLRQAPGIMRSIQQEKKWLDDKFKREGLDVIISDHRYGLYHPKIYSVFIAHQLFITSGSNDLMDSLLWKVNKSYIENFDQCWIPDLPKEPNASCKLSHKHPIPFRHHYIGLLTRFKRNVIAEKDYRISFILSGLEPLRTQLENLIIEQAYKLPVGKYLLVRGTNQPIQKTPMDHLEIINFADSNMLQSIIESSELLLSRAGYTSIMDYLSMGSKALLIPTPGQTEQEYLAQYHLELGNFYSIEQDQLDLVRDQQLALTYQPSDSYQFNLLEAAIQDLIKSIN